MFSINSVAVLLSFLILLATYIVGRLESVLDHPNRGTVAQAFLHGDSDQPFQFAAVAMMRVISIQFFTTIDVPQMAAK